MANREQIAVLLEVARTRTHEAARMLVALRDANMSARGRLDVLLQYRAEYDQQLQALMHAGATGAQLRNFYGFLAALEEAIARQRATAGQAQARFDGGKAEWQQQWRRQNGFETLAQRLRRAELHEQGRREQRATDELAVRPGLPGIARA